MKLQQVKEIAQQRGIKPGRLKKAEIIQAIQAAEGNSQCYNTQSVESCGQSQCLWRGDCK